MSDPNISPELKAQIEASNRIMTELRNQTDLTKVMILKELLTIYDIPISISGDEHIISNIEMITEYPNANYTKMMVKNETWRQSVKEVFHLESIDMEKIVGFHDYQVMLKMISHKRKRSTEIVNGIRNESALTEVVPNRTRTKAFFGMGNK